MFKSSAGLAAMLLVTACSALGPSPSQDPDALKEQLISLEKASWVAWQKRDGAFFSSFLSEDHVEIGAFGPSNKTEVVGFVGSPACVVESYALNAFQVTRISADSALLVYHAEQKTTCGGAAVPSPVWVSSLFVYRGGHWLNVLYQQSKAAK